MKERPILFSSAMIRAILEGRKTQTRRVGRYQMPEATELRVESIGHATKGTIYQATYRAFPNRGTARWAICEFPYGVIGDQLWVRETFTLCESTRSDGHRAPLYWATSVVADEIKWKPAIFMPRWASRITLEITSVRAERVQEISEGDAIEEGITWDQDHDYVGEYRKLWDSINAKRGFGWDVNPWVWVIDFQRTEAR